jgi:hypothetical protein
MATEYMIQYRDAEGQWSAGGPMWRTSDPVAALETLRSDPGRYRVRRARYGRRDLTEADLVQAAGGPTGMDRLDPCGGHDPRDSGWGISLDEEMALVPSGVTVQADARSVRRHGHTTRTTVARHREGLTRYLDEMESTDPPS